LFLLVVTTAVIIFLLLISVFVLPSFRSTVAATEPVLALAQSGVVFSDPLNATQSQTQLQASSSWSFGGHYDSEHIAYNGQNWQYSANGSLQNANVNFSEDGSGLSISVKAAESGPYTGFYAISPPSNAELYHARMTSIYDSIPGEFLQIGLYVRAASGDTNYIACASVTSSGGAHWEIIHGTGNSVEATNFDYLWIDNSTNGPITADCTIITNGNNYLAVYLGGALVYQNSDLSLGIQSPIEVYLGVESSSSAEAFTGTWSSYYSTQTGSVEAINLPETADNMSIVGSNGTLLGSAAVDNGTGLVSIAQYDFPVSAFIKAYNSNGTEVASTSAPVELMGGDIFSAKATIQQQVGSVVGVVSDPNLFYILIPLVVVVLALSLALSYSRNRRRSSIRDPTSY
jgi:hypothetical protein